MIFYVSPDHKEMLSAATMRKTYEVMNRLWFSGSLCSSMSKGNLHHGESRFVGSQDWASWVFLGMKLLLSPPCFRESKLSTIISFLKGLFMTPSQCWPPLKYNNQSWSLDQPSTINFLNQSPFIGLMSCPTNGHCTWFLMPFILL